MKECERCVRKAKFGNASFISTDTCSSSVALIISFREIDKCLNISGKCAMNVDEKEGEETQRIEQLC